MTIVLDILMVLMWNTNLKRRGRRNLDVFISKLIIHYSLAGTTNWVLDTVALDVNTVKSTVVLCEIIIVVVWIIN